MRLKYLEIQGFKSFADKVRINFEGGVTAVVGPNGCGKSNIVDALRWVLCETNPRRVRCLREKDVIFHGSASRSQVGFAQVNLMLDNSDSWLNLDMAEVLVARKLYASGESGYFINKEKVRLKDIKELFMNTGVVSNTYSTLELREVRAILESSPEDLRTLFDEAAGVTKYRVHRDEAQRRITRTQDDLNRVRDIISELENEIKLLDAQARKAKRFEALKIKLDEGITSNILLDYKDFYERKNTMGKELDASSDTLTQRRAGLTAVSAEADKKRIDLDMIEEKLYSERSSSTNVFSSLKVLEERLSGAAAKLKELPDEIKEARGRLEETSRNLEAKKPEYESLRGRKDEMQKAFESIKAMMEAEASSFDEKLQAAKNALFETLRESSAAANGIRSAEDEIEKINRLTAKLSSEISELEKNILSVRGEIETAKKANGDIEKKINGFEEAAKAAASAIAAERKKEQELKSAADKVRQEIYRLEAARDQAAMRKTAYEKFLSSRKDQGILGDLESALAGAGKWKEALSSFLANLPRVVFVKDYSCIEALSSGEDVPYMIFISAREIMDYQLPDGAAQPFEGLEIKDEYADKFLRIIFSKFGFSPAEGGRAVFTPDSSVKFPFGKICGKARRFSDPAAAQKNIASQRDKLKEAQKLVEDCLGNIRKLEAEQVKTASSIAGEREKIIENGARVKMFENRVADRDDALEEKRFEKKHLEESLEKHKSDITDKKQKLEALNVKHKLHQDNLTSVERTVASAEETRKHISQAEYEAKKQQYEKFAVEYEAASETVERLDEEKKSLEKNIGRMEHEMKYLNERNIQMKEELGDLKKKNADAVMIMKELEEKQKGGRKELEDLRKKVSALNSDVYEAQKHTEVAKSDISHAEEMLKGLSHRLGEEFNLTIDEAWTKYPEPQRFPEEEIGKMKARVEAIGSVNLLAPEDYERVKKRYDFLKGQSDDLEKAIADINSIISEANKQIKENFLVTFEQAKENFKNVYANFFEGGTADIILTDPSNPIESGVEVKAAPPGKKVSSNTQLSSGENALTAIAILFALFQIKPSPFCILDEVDAPLDDSNVVRFNKLIKEYSHKTQFVAITHNKRTMEMADVMYGITMEEFGVSKLISVKYRKVGEENEVS
ncbi:MAG: AAA family ATPase [Candidatus Omnitrophota bacterium]|nr:AAA family ATPase [Candidatus Omnitrophota bacterium]MBU2529085.1 AAA family ATPase [bacterium]MBU3930373.1 AAA family ATPase [bacterium]MBU4122751.1 AAA family ATPase [bacterium]